MLHVYWLIQVRIQAECNIRICSAALPQIAATTEVVDDEAVHYRRMRSSFACWPTDVAPSSFVAARRYIWIWRHLYARAHWSSVAIGGREAGKSDWTAPPSARSLTNNNTGRARTLRPAAHLPVIIVGSVRTCMKAGLYQRPAADRVGGPVAAARALWPCQSFCHTELRNAVRRENIFRICRYNKVTRRRS